MAHHDEHHTHEFDCRHCGAHLDSRDELDRHNRDNHGGQRADSTGGDSDRERGSVGSEGGGNRFGSSRSDLS
jgi:hypothetical protein